ncbi:MAG TPA: flagellar biosynthetic protein FliR [Balneolales bacterium]|nr:flagellar biosynthetic protein FliR [Balneolales bacterium]
MSFLSIPFILTAFLIFVRVSSILMTAPFFGSEMIPKRVKLFFAMMVTVLLYPVIPLQGATIPVTANSFDVIIAIFKEVSVGLAMGLVGQLIFGGVQFGGQFISIQVGLGFSSVIDPLTQQQNGVISQMLILLGTIFFLAIGGDQIYIKAMVKSFEIVPLGTVHMAAPAPELVKMAGELFVIGVQVASPFIIVFFLMDLTFAIFARIMPQANVFFIELPLKVYVGLIMFGIIVPRLLPAFENFFSMLFHNLEVILKVLSG